MAAEGSGTPHSGMDDAAPRTASDVVLGGVALVVSALGVAAVDDVRLGRRDQRDGWAFPVAICGLLAVVGVILLVRGCLLGRGRAGRWSLRALVTIAAVVGAVGLAARHWGYDAVLRFGPPELAALLACELAIAIALARMSRIRAAAMVLLGLLVATIGTDLQMGGPRLTMGMEALADGIAQIIVSLGLVVVADGAICLVSPSFFLAIYARQVAGWASPRVPTSARLAMRIAAALAITAACFAAFERDAAAWGVGKLLVIGTFGFACKVFGWNRLLLLLGFAYGPLLEANIRRAMLLSQGDLAIFLRWPISGTLLLLSGTILAVAALSSARHAMVGRLRG